MWVAPRSIMDKTEVRTPRTAPISWPLRSGAAGTPKKCRNNSYVPSIRCTFMLRAAPHAILYDAIRKKPKNAEAAVFAEMPWDETRLKLRRWPLPPRRDPRAPLRPIIAGAGREFHMGCGGKCSEDESFPLLMTTYEFSAIQSSQSDTEEIDRDQ